MPHNVASEEEFSKLIGSGQVTAVDFYAPWCGACTQFMPKFEGLEPQFPSAQFLKVNVDELEEIAGDHDVTGLPYLVIFKDGKKVDGFSNLTEQGVAAALEKQGAQRDGSAANTAKEAPKAEAPKEAPKAEAPAAKEASKPAGAAPHDVQSEEEFAKLLKTDKVTLVDFYAPWCGACKTFMPDYEALCKAHPGAQFLKVNVDELEEIAGDHDVTGLPYLVIFKGGKKVDGFSSLTKSSVEEALLKHQAGGGAATAAVVKTGVSSFEVTDPKSGNVLAFTADGDAVKYTVAGEERPRFRQAQSDGHNRLLFPDISKGATLPEKDLHVHLGNLLSLLDKVGGEALNFPSEVPVQQ